MSPGAKKAVALARLALDSAKGSEHERENARTALGKLIKEKPEIIIELSGGQDEDLPPAERPRERAEQKARSVYDDFWGFVDDVVSKQTRVTPHPRPFVSATRVVYVKR